MNTRALEASVLPAPAAWVGILRSASRRINWRVVAATAAIAAGLEIYVIFEFTFDGVTPGSGPPVPAQEVYVSGAVINIVMAFAMMFATFAADEWVARGAKRRLAYPLGVVTASAVGALLQRQLHGWLHLPSRYDGAGVSPDLSMMEPAVVFFEYLIWGSIIVFIYVNRRTALRAAARMNQAQVEQTLARRHTLEARLQALQARVEPQFLFNTLAKVRILYDEDRERGSRLLEDLIVYLRTALPQFRDPMSTLERELRLVTSYLNIMRAQIGDGFAFDVEAPQGQAAGTAVFPPMILLPLVDHLLVVSRYDDETASRTVRIVARVDASRVRVELSAFGENRAADRDRDVLIDIRERLHALYGDLGRLGLESTDAPGTRVIMEIPYEPPDGDHR